MGYNRSGTKFVARMKRRRREAERLAEKAAKAGKTPSSPKVDSSQKKALTPK